MAQTATASGRSLPTISSAPANQPAELPLYEKMALAARDAFLQVCDETTWLREMSFAMQIIGGNKLLQDVCKTPAGAQSIKNSIINVAMTGTTLNPVMQMAYLVPRSIKGIMMCCLDFSYRGLAGIAMASGAVKHIGPRVVYKFDEFDYREEDGEQHITFKKNMDPPPDFIAGPAKFWDYLVCGYVVATLADGTKVVTEPLPKWKLKKAMDTSKTSGSNTPWQTHPDEQCLKTLVKHAHKLLPQTPALSKAVAVLNEHEGIETDADRRSQVMSAAENAFSAGAPEDATFTEIKPGAQGAAATQQQTGTTKETTMDPVLTPSQCEEINRMITEVEANYEQFMNFLGVKHLADVTQSNYGTAIAALENKKRQAEVEASKKTGGSQQQDLLDGTTGSSSYTNSAIMAALAAKNIMCQSDETNGTVWVKINYNDGANKEFIKGLGFRWNPDAKQWYWTPSA